MNSDNNPEVFFEEKGAYKFFIQLYICYLAYNVM